MKTVSLLFSRLLLAALLFVSPAAAQDDDSTIVLEGDHGGGYVHRPGGFVPIHAELSNNGAVDVTVRLEADWDGLQGNLLRRVDLPAGSFKEIDLVLGPAAHAGEYEVRVVDDETDELLEDLFLTSVVVAEDRPLIGLLDPHPMGWGRLQDRHKEKRQDEETGEDEEEAARPERKEKFQGKIVHLQTKFLPTLGEALNSFDILVWPDPRPGRLRDDQAAMLAHWTELGGTLVLAADRSGRNDLQRWTSLRPGDVGTTDRLTQLTARYDLPSSPLATPIAIAPIETAEGAQALFAIERRGRGRVVVLGFDPRAPALAGRPELTALWEELLDLAFLPASENDANYYGWSWDLRTQARHYLTRGVGGLPLPLSALGFLLLLYLAVIGPGEYLILKRLDRLKWTWITFPLWVLLFTASAWAIAAISRTGEPILRQIVLRDAPPGSEFFCEEVHEALFVLRSGEYRLNTSFVGPEVPLTRTGDADSFFGWGRGSRFMTHNWHFGPSAISGRIPKWSFLTGAFLHHSPRLEARVELEGSLREGRLTPRIGADLEDAVLLSARDGVPHIVRLGALQDGVGVAVADPEPLIENPADFSTYRDLHKNPENSQDLEEFFGDLIYLTARELTAKLGEGSENYEFNRFYDDPHPMHDWSLFLRDGGKILLGWTTDEEPRVDVEGLDRPVKTSGIVVYRFAVRPQSGESS